MADVERVTTDGYPVAELGENVLYLQANSAGKHKFDVRWHEGIWLGIRDESGESVVGTPEGVVKAKDFRRKRDHDERWNVSRFDVFRGVPWEPIPGIGGEELRTFVSLPVERSSPEPMLRSIDDYVPRRFRIRKEDLERYGYIVGCPGCKAANRGQPHVAHAEECRKRIESKLAEVEDVRLKSQKKRLATGKVKRTIQQDEDKDVVDKGEKRKAQEEQLQAEQAQQSSSSGLKRDAQGREAQHEQAQADGVRRLAPRELAR